MQPKSTDPEELPVWVKAIFGGVAFTISVALACLFLAGVFKAIVFVVGL